MLYQFFHIKFVKPHMHFNEQYWNNNLVAQQRCAWFSSPFENPARFLRSGNNALSFSELMTFRQLVLNIVDLKDFYSLLKTKDPDWVRFFVWAVFLDQRSIRATPVGLLNLSEQMSI